MLEPLLHTYPMNSISVFKIQAGSVPKGSVFTEAKISLPWLVLLEKSRTDPNMKAILESLANPVLQADRIWQSLAKYQDPSLDMNKGKIAFYSAPAKNFQDDVLGQGRID